MVSLMGIRSRTVTWVWMEREEDMSDITEKKKGRTWCLSAWKGKKDMEGMTIYTKI